MWKQRLWIRRIVTGLLLPILTISVSLGAQTKSRKNQPAKEPSPIDRLLASTPPPAANGVSSPGSTFSTTSPLLDLASDVHARNAGDLVTIVVLDQASATSQGVTTQQRTSSASSSISSLFGVKSAHNALNNLANINSQQQLNGQGTTSRQTTVSTTVSARVIRVLPNGDLIVEGAKLISVNSEFQTVSLRGIVRPVDLGASNSVGSNQVEDLEVRINGRGVVNDAIRRPNFLYRLFLGILPF
ncbi:MAG TPA: flagellar basal body L-ring protein FlgH [Bryobacteraceae bacterium]|jgi:flagellar L-ring protein precursor FlgH|nr:flagellar basal body L-ring protein FlgH [Bryobacteraceae bacterium]